MEHFHKIICVFAQRGHAKGSEIKGKLMTLNIQNNKKNATEDTINDWQRI